MNYNLIYPILYLVSSAAIYSSPIYQKIPNVNIREFFFCSIILSLVGFGYYSQRKCNNYEWPTVRDGVVFFLIAVIFTLLEPLVISQEQSMNLNVEINNAYFYLYLFSAIIMSPFIEEIIFRSFLYDFFSEFTKGSITSIVIVSILFSIAHLTYSNISSFIVIFLFSVFLCIARIKTKGILIPILMHITTNLIVYFPVLM